MPSEWLEGARWAAFQPIPRPFTNDAMDAFSDEGEHFAEGLRARLDETAPRGFVCIEERVFQSWSNDPATGESFPVPMLHRTYEMPEEGKEGEQDG